MLPAGGIASCFQLAYAISLMGCSEIADRVGAQRVFLTGTLASAVTAALFAAFARDYWSGLVLYTLLALALGGTYTTGVLLVAENVPVARRGRAMGFFLAGHSLGLALALALTGVATNPTRPTPRPSCVKSDLRTSSSNIARTSRWCATPRTWSRPAPEASTSPARCCTIVRPCW